MRILPAAASLLVALSLTACASTSRVAATPDASELVGAWAVDLRPTPDAEPYVQRFEITAVSGRRFEGTFYGAPISQGFVNTDWGTVRLGFITADGSGPYAHAAEYDPATGALRGTTISSGREFLSVWTAERE